MGWCKPAACCTALSVPPDACADFPAPLTCPIPRCTAALHPLVPLHTAPYHIVLPCTAGRTSSIGQHSLCLGGRGEILNDPTYKTLACADYVAKASKARIILVSVLPRTLPTIRRIPSGPNVCSPCPARPARPARVHYAPPHAPRAFPPAAAVLTRSAPSAPLPCSSSLPYTPSGRAPLLWARGGGGGRDSRSVPEKTMQKRRRREKKIGDPSSRPAGPLQVVTLVDLAGHEKVSKWPCALGTPLPFERLLCSVLAQALGQPGPKWPRPATGGSVTRGSIAMRSHPCPQLFMHKAMPRHAMPCYVLTRPPPAHAQYFKTTAYGLTGHLPDYACLIVGANAGGLLVQSIFYFLFSRLSFCCMGVESCYPRGAAGGTSRP